MAARCLRCKILKHNYISIVPLESLTLMTRIDESPVPPRSVLWTPAIYVEQCCEHKRCSPTRPSSRLACVYRNRFYSLCLYLSKLLLSSALKFLGNNLNNFFLSFGAFDLSFWIGKEILCSDWCLVWFWKLFEKLFGIIKNITLALKTSQCQIHCLNQAYWFLVT